MRPLICTILDDASNSNFEVIATILLLQIKNVPVDQKLIFFYFKSPLLLAEK